MPMDFPSFPVNGQEFVVGTVTYVYNGTGWVVKGSTADQFVVKSGDTMTGHLGLPSGPAASQAVRKDYVDGADSAIGTSIGLKADKTYVDAQDNLKVNKSGDVMVGALNISVPVGGNSNLFLNGATPNSGQIVGQKGGSLRWICSLGDGVTEAGGNIGSDFGISRFDNAGALLGRPLVIYRSDGHASFESTTPSTSPTTGALIVAGGVGINGDLNVNGNIVFKGVPAAPFDAMAYNGIQVNGGMEVSQELGATPIAISNIYKYVVDGWNVSANGAPAVSCSQVADAPLGYAKSLRIAVTTAVPSPVGTDLVVVQSRIEAYRISRLGAGTINAQPITIAFWCKTHRPGVYSGTLTNEPTTFTYPFQFTQTTADVWQYQTITIPGHTASAWYNDNRIGMTVGFSLMCGTTFSAAAGGWRAGTFYGASGSVNGVAATSDVFQITGVTVLPGTQAPNAAQSPLIMRPYDQELVLCQRYFYKEFGPSRATLGPGVVFSNNLYGMFYYPATMRASPTLTLGGSWRVLPSAGILASVLATDVNLNSATWYAPIVVADGTSFLAHGADGGNAFIVGDARL